MMDFRQMNHGRSEGEDPAMTALLRNAYSAPSSSSYWAGLEQRVMARVKEAQPLAWWSVFSEWRTAALVAATMALLLAGAAMVRQRSLDPAKTPMATGVPADTTYDLALKRVLDGDGVTFTSIPRRKLPDDAPERYLNPLDW